MSPSITGSHQRDMRQTFRAAASDRPPLMLQNFQAARSAIAFGRRLVKANHQLVRPLRGVRTQQMGKSRSACRKATAAFRGGEITDNMWNPALAYDDAVRSERELKCGNCQEKSSRKSAHGAS